MSDASATIERSDLILDELAKLGLGLARDLAQQAGAAEDADQAARLALAFAQVSRSVRQSLALQAKLAHDARRGLRETREDDVRENKLRREQRAVRVRNDVRRAIYAEAPERERPEMLSRLEVILLAETADAEFLAGPVERHIARIRRILGLPEPEPATPPTGASRQPPRRSSA